MIPLLAGSSCHRGGHRVLHGIMQSALHQMMRISSVPGPDLPRIRPFWNCATVYTDLVSLSGTSFPTGRMYERAMMAGSRQGALTDACDAAKLETTLIW